MPAPVPVRRAPPVRAGRGELFRQACAGQAADGEAHRHAHCIKRDVKESFPFPFHSIQRFV